MLVWRGTARMEAGTGDDGVADMREAVRLLEEQGHPKAAIAAFNLGAALRSLGRMQDAAVALEAAKASADRAGNGRIRWFDRAAHPRSHDPRVDGGSCVQLA